MSAILIEPSSHDTKAGLRILQCVRVPEGGILRHIRDLLQQLGRLGTSLAIVYDADAELPASVERELAAYCNLGVLRLSIPRRPAARDAANIAKLVRFCRKVGIDVIHGHGAKGGLYARVVGRLLGHPSVYTPHGGVLHYSRARPNGFVYLGIERLLLPWTGVVILESEFANREFHAKIGAPASAKVIHNGIAEDDFCTAAPEDRRFDFAYVGLMRRIKGVDVLLRAAARLEAEGLSFQLGLFGAGPDEAAFRALGRSLGLTSVTWCGPTRTGREALATARCLIVPSRRESLGYVVMEAAAMGIPAIANDVGGIPEIVGPDHPLVPVEDVGALAARMRAFLDDPVAAEAGAIAIRARVAERFRVEDMAKGIEAVYRRLHLSRMRLLPAETPASRR